MFSIFGQWKTIFQQMHLLPDLLAGTNLSLHTEITSLISFLSEVGNSLILTTEDINLQ